MRIFFVAYRVIGAAVIAAAVIGQFLYSLEYRAERGIAENGIPVVNFFSFFTIDSNLMTVAVLLVGAVLLVRGGVHPLGYDVARAAVTAYMTTTGIVYNTLLRGIELDGATLGWSNEILHVVGPLLIVVDWLFAPGRRRLEWKHIGAIVAFPIVWAVYTMVRGPFVVDPTLAFLLPGYEIGWYPYPFLNPANSDLGYVSVAFYVVLIAVVIGGVGAAIIAVSRRRERWPLPAVKV